MNTNMSLRNDRFRQEMEVNPSLQKVIAVYHIIQVIAVIICVAVSITSLLFYIALSVIIPVILFIIFWVASKCNFQDLVVILVHFNPILSTMWFLVIFPFFVMACVLNKQLGMYSYYYAYTVDVRVTIVAVVTGILSLSSAIFAVMGIWKSARKVVLSARSGDRDHVSATSCGPPPYETPVTITDLNGIQIAQSPYGQASSDQPLLTL
ncbi:hypothetical protein CHS0354_039558 [Potamilus streckersoni]|uniref:Uncharacterized protein n=1 Tax=Potamilus streckersoni TaxID=2493646 RepID=A0AAE0W322_9BIVA|nr:hypothetical protein CHS0354_039558 [Potamilus streckersoni]